MVRREMALVDYSSSGSDSDGPDDPESPQPANKRQKLDCPPPGPPPKLPPLPAAFHDLYASTVRHSTADDPSLHQGRTRQTPHVPGRWPSHLYVEWHPHPRDHTSLVDLLTSLRARLAGLHDDSFSFDSLLTSDLGAPQPLHISLSRPLSLATADKDVFLDRVTSDIAASAIQPFELRCRGLEWHRTAESNRSFLVLRVQEGAAPAAAASNPRLTELLRRCNAAASAFGQPELYQWAAGRAHDGRKTAAAAVGDAFHLSIAWSFAEPSGELGRQAAALFDELPAAAAIRILVDGVKAKIGNVVTHIPLPERGEGEKLRGRGNILGI